MQIAIVGAGYTGGEADQLRRDMAAWKRTGKLARHRERLLAGFEKTGIAREFGERLYQSHRTVATHLYQIFPKLGVTSRTALRDALSSNEGREEV